MYNRIHNFILSSAEDNSILNFIFDCAGSSCYLGFSLVAASRGYSLVVVQRHITAEPSPAGEHRVHGLQQLWHTGSVVEFTGPWAQAQKLWCTGLAAL